MAQGRRWQHDEIVLALELYCRTPFGRLHYRNPEIVSLAQTLGRTPGSVAMKCCNFASLDPAENARGIRGLSGASDADKLVFARLAHDLTALDAARIEAARSLGIALMALDVHAPVDHLEQLGRRLVGRAGESEATLVRRARRLSALFREVVLVSYGGACAVCTLAVSHLLDAAHIVPWSEESDRQLDPANGIAMCCLHHRSFDAGLMTVGADGKIRVSQSLRAKSPPPIHRIALLDIDGQDLRLPRRFRPSVDAFAYHRENVFQT